MSNIVQMYSRWMCVTQNISCKILEHFEYDLQKISI